MKDLTAFVLAGGKSTRMGTDKALLCWGDGTLIAHVFKLVSAVSEQVCVVGDTKAFASFGTIVEDIYRGRGPLGGIHAALANTASELNLVLAVDLPFVDRRFLEYLVLQARNSNAIVTVPRAAGGWQPLCAVYRPDFFQLAEQSLRAGQNKIDLLFANVDIRTIDEPELQRAGFSTEMFRNLNTREEFQQASRGPASSPLPR